jgi:hypothetical protein
MPRYADDERFVDAIDENGLVKDGKGLRVSFMDAMRARQPERLAGIPASLPARPYVVDRRPGGPYVIDRRSAPAAADMADARQILYDEYRAYDTADTNRWRAPPNGPQRDQSMNYTGGDPTETGHGAPGRGRQRIPAGAYPY